MQSRVDIKQETVLVPRWYHEESEKYELKRWVVRYIDNQALVGYSSTWFGAWRIACGAVGWKVPV